jgi:gluconate 2-dehydrogenase gamma chain
MSGVSRRIFLQVSGAATVAPAAGAAVAQQPGAAGPAGAASANPAASTPYSYQFFNAPEAAFIEAAVDRLIPPDATGPSASEAGVPDYLDRQLAGAWGAGERLYRSGPWQAGSPTQGYQLPFTPAELFRTALRGIRNDLQQQGKGAFEALPGPQQDAYLTQLEHGTREFEGVPGKVFFETLLGMTVEGYLGDPVYGGNKGMAAWRMIGFPGAYAAYYEFVDQYGATFAEPPRSLAEQRGEVHVMPNIPASIHGHEGVVHGTGSTPAAKAPAARKGGH